MAISKSMDEIDSAINADSWEWLQADNAPLANAVKAEVKRGTKPKRIRQYLLGKIGIHRAALAYRVEQAAAHLSNGHE